MFGWLLKKRVANLEEKAQEGFSAVRGDIQSVGKWIKHLEQQDKQLFEVLSRLNRKLSTISEEVGILREQVGGLRREAEDKQVFKKLPVYGKQTAVGAVQNVVQTAVQTGNLYDILKKLSSHERLVLFTLMNSEMKLSYEDLAMVLGKEKSTIRGQINSIKQKSEGLIEEISEKNGKKRVFVPDEIKVKLQKYAKVRVGRGSKGGSG